VELAQRLAKALDVTMDHLVGPEAKDARKAPLRPAVARLVALVKDMDDGQVDDIARA